MSKRGKGKSAFGKFWYLLWNDNSLKGWVFSILFIFIFIKFIFFPGLTLVTGTSLPLAIVESCSMYHDNGLFSNFDSWYKKHESKYSEFTINQFDFKDFTLKNGFDKGDILFIVGANPDKLKEGDIIVFDANQQNPVIHRIVDIKNIGGERIFSTIGDNNWAQIVPPNMNNVDETDINENQILGKAVLRVAPYFGWMKLIFFEKQKPRSERGFCEER